MTLRRHDVVLLARRSSWSNHCIAELHNYGTNAILARLRCSASPIRSEARFVIVAVPAELALNSLNPIHDLVGHGRDATADMDLPAVAVRVPTTGTNWRSRDA